jgi:hypothetical protein
LNLSVTAGVNSYYVYWHPTKANEFYMISNLQKAGRDAGLPDFGLAIWHVDTNGDNDNQEMTPLSHYMVTLVQADGQWDLERSVNMGDTTDLYEGQTLTGSGIPGNTKLFAVINGTTIAMDKNATATDTGITLTASNIYDFDADRLFGEFNVAWPYAGLTTKSFSDPDGRLSLLSR